MFGQQASELEYERGLFASRLYSRPPGLEAGPAASLLYGVIMVGLGTHRRMLVGNLWAALACAALPLAHTASAVECKDAARIAAMLGHVTKRCPELALTEVGARVRQNLAKKIAAADDQQCAAGGHAAMLEDLTLLDPSLKDMAEIGNQMIFDAALCQTIRDYFTGLSANSDTPEFVKEKE